jgi:hypothetical protein
LRKFDYSLGAFHPTAQNKFRLNTVVDRSIDPLPSLVPVYIPIPTKVDQVQILYDWKGSYIIENHLKPIMWHITLWIYLILMYYYGQFRINRARMWQSTTSCSRSTLSILHAFPVKSSILFIQEGNQFIGVELYYSAKC